MKFSYGCPVMNWLNLLFFDLLIRRRRRSLFGNWFYIVNCVDLLLSDTVCPIKWHDTLHLTQDYSPSRLASRHFVWPANAVQLQFVSSSFFVFFVIFRLIFDLSMAGDSRTIRRLSHETDTSRRRTQIGCWCGDVLSILVENGTRLSFFGGQKTTHFLSFSRQ